jgi:hypothetical protein
VPAATAGRMHRPKGATAWQEMDDILFADPPLPLELFDPPELEL